jgi:hypothetical protein
MAEMAENNSPLTDFFRADSTNSSTNSAKLKPPPAAALPVADEDNDDEFEDAKSAVADEEDFTCI